jgi:hypothetical protein
MLINKLAANDLLNIDTVNLFTAGGFLNRADLFFVIYYNNKDNTYNLFSGPYISVRAADAQRIEIINRKLNYLASKGLT